jgi:hypothetical protein
MEGLLVPRRDKSDIGGIPARPLAEEFPTLVVPVSSDGVVRFEHVKPDRYRLVIKRNGVTKAVYSLDVPNSNVDAGKIPVNVVTATSVVEGRIWRPKPRGAVWALAKGFVMPQQVTGDEGITPFVDRFYRLPPDGIEFEADENGRFRIEGVPEGVVTVGFPYAIGHSVKAYEWSVRLLRGQTSTLRAFDPAQPQDLAFAIKVGDGSIAQYESGTGQKTDQKANLESSLVRGSIPNHEPNPPAPQLRAELTLISKDRAAFAQPELLSVDQAKPLVLSEIDPGTYRLRVFDWTGTRSEPFSSYDRLLGRTSDEALSDGQVVVQAGQHNVAPISLGAGCITGEIAGISEPVRDGYVEVIALDNTHGNYPRRVWCGSGGKFCIRYLFPGTYSLYVHKLTSGFCQIDRIKVAAGIIDVGKLSLRSGATLVGAIRYPRLSLLADDVVAVGPSNVTLVTELKVYSSFDAFEFRGLSPGHWTVSARCHGTVIAKSELNVAETETFRSILTAEGVR